MKNDTIQPNSFNNHSYLQHQFFINTKSKYLDIIDDPQAFQFFIQRQFSLDEDPIYHIIISTACLTNNEPILGYGNSIDSHD